MYPHLNIEDMKYMIMARKIRPLQISKKDCCAGGCCCWSPPAAAGVPLAGGLPPPAGATSAGIGDGARVASYRISWSVSGAFGHLPAVATYQSVIQSVASSNVMHQRPPVLPGF